MLKFLQRLALDFPCICVQFFPGLSYRQMYRKFKKVVLACEQALGSFWGKKDQRPVHRLSGSRSSSACNAHNFFSVESLGVKLISLQLIFFSEQPFYENYSTLDFHTNIVIFHAFAYYTRQDGFHCDVIKFCKVKVARFYQSLFTVG